MSAPFVECEGVVHIYRSDRLEVVALQGLDLAVAEGEVIAVVGRSGSGKTTLMNILAGVEPPTAGRVRVGGVDLGALDESRRVLYRRQAVGYIWQNARQNVSPELSAADNVQLPMLAGALRPSERRRRAFDLLGAMGVGGRAGRLPAELTTGELQRLAVAVALANRPRLLLADEPTGELDTSTAQELLADLRALARELGTTVITVTHDPQVERHVDRVIQIRDGRTSTETRHRLGSDGSLVADELVIMDRAGRLQLPRAHVERLGLGGRVRVHLEEGRIVISPAEEPPRSPGAGTGG
jgi:ABC-type lipoprotein export system ATPase subunit